MSEEAKGLIYTLGDNSELHLPLSIGSKENSALANSPKIFFPIRILSFFGIKKVLIAGTAKTIVDLQESMRKMDGFEIDLSYLLVTDNDSIGETIAAANEYVAQSPLVIIRPLICTLEAIHELRSQLQKCSGVTAFKFLRVDGQADKFTPSLLRVGVRSRFKFQEAMSRMELDGSFESLKDFCMDNSIYQEVAVDFTILGLRQTDQDLTDKYQSAIATLKINREWGAEPN